MEFVDKKLVAKARLGDMVAFSELIQMYKDKIFNLAYRMLGNVQEAEDISQETFLKVYANLNSYDDQFKFSTWIYRIATNLCIDRIRKKKAVYSLDKNWEDSEQFDWHSRLADDSRTPEEEVILNETQLMVQDALLQLPPKYRVIMNLRYLQELSVQEISEVVNLSVSTVKTRLHRGREYLRKYLINTNAQKERGGQYELS